MWCVMCINENCLNNKHNKTEAFEIAHFFQKCKNVVQFCMQLLSKANTLEIQFFECLLIFHTWTISLCLLIFSNVKTSPYFSIRLCCFIYQVFWSLCTVCVHHLLDVPANHNCENTTQDFSKSVIQQNFPDLLFCFSFSAYHFI